MKLSLFLMTEKSGFFLIFVKFFFILFSKICFINFFNSFLFIFNLFNFFYFFLFFFVKICLNSFFFIFQNFFEFFFSKFGMEVVSPIFLSVVLGLQTAKVEKKDFWVLFTRLWLYMTHLDTPDLNQI